jgi:hypothetical protein
MQKILGDGKPAIRKSVGSSGVLGRDLGDDLI